MLALTRMGHSRDSALEVVENTISCTSEHKIAIENRKQDPYYKMIKPICQVDFQTRLAHVRKA